MRLFHDRAAMALSSTRTSLRPKSSSAHGHVTSYAECKSVHNFPGRRFLRKHSCGLTSFWTVAYNDRCRRQVQPEMDPQMLN